MLLLLLLFFRSIDQTLLKVKNDSIMSWDWRNQQVHGIKPQSIHQNANIETCHCSKANN